MVLETPLLAYKRMLMTFVTPFSQRLEAVQHRGLATVVRSMPGDRVEVASGVKSERSQENAVAIPTLLSNGGRLQA